MGLNTFSLKIYPASTLEPILVHHFFTGVCKHESYVLNMPPPPRGNIFKLDLRVAQQDPYLATLGKSLLKLIKLLRLCSVRMKWG